MYLQILKFTLFSFITVAAFTGCGGGSSSSSESSSSTPNTTTQITDRVQSPLTASTTYQNLFHLLETQTDKTGLVMDAHGVEGLRVTCATQEATTTKNGLFKCEGTPLTIYLGNFKVGTLSQVPKDKIIYTQDILNVPRAATVHPDVTKLSMILQSLDEDADLSNGIEIIKESMNILDNELANFTNIHQLTLDDTNQVIDNVIAQRKANNENVKLHKVSKKEAQINLTEALSNTPGSNVDMATFNSITL